MDDLAIILEEPTRGFKALKQELNKYAEVSKMKINLEKMKMLVKNLPQGGRGDAAWEMVAV